MNANANDMLIDHIRQIRKKEYSRLQDCTISSNNGKITFHVSNHSQISIIPGQYDWVSVGLDQATIDLSFSSDVEIDDVHIYGENTEVVTSFVKQVIADLHRTTLPVCIRKNGTIADL